MESIRQKQHDEKSAISEVFNEYLSNTTIHGISYLGARDRNKIEKAWWIIVFIISVITCGYLISNTWKKWKESPVIVSFSEEQTPIWDIPFPAITICPLNKVKGPIYNYTEMYPLRDTLIKEEKKIFWDISQVCNLKWVVAQNASNITDEDIISNIKMVSPTLEDTIEAIIWKNDLYQKNSSLLFSTQLTSDGICFSFNSLAQDDVYTNQIKQNVEFISKNNRKNTGWSIEKGYPKESNSQYPERTSQDGVNFGISISMRSLASDRDFHCGDPITGFKILLHNPAESPRVNHQYFLAPINRHVTVSVTPKVVTTSEGLLDISAHTRNCFFPHEKKLRFFQFYTQNNCRTECLANLTKAFCQCLPFYMPRDNSTDICGYGKMECMKNVHKKITKFEILLQNNPSNKVDKNSNEYNIFKECDCIPPCSSLDYTSETSQAAYYWIKSLYKKVLYSDEDPTKIRNESLNFDEELTQIVVFFKETQFISLHRQELYGQTDFLANCGGLLGLFMGFSFLSLLEIIYFATLRLWFYIQKRKRTAMSVIT